MPQAWILCHLKAHGTRPVTHNEPITLKTYFDEDVSDRSDLAESDDSFIVSAEHSITFETKQDIRCYHMISDVEFAAGSYQYFVWCEPYAIAALAKQGALASGRLELSRGDEARRVKGSSIRPPLNGVAPDDDVIVFELDLVNSVVQFIVDEMNANRSSNLVLRHRDMLDDPALLRWIQRPWSTYDAFRQFHTDSGWQGTLQDILAFGGGSWDHKPRIGAVWGQRNRLGNSVDVYYYDYWSNLHFGYIMAMAGYETGGVLLSSNIAQQLDRGGADSRFDQEPMLAGWNLGQAHGLRLSGVTVTRQNVIDILNRHPHWPEYSRNNAPAPSSSSGPSVLQELQDQLNRFDNMSPIDQANYLRRLFGG